LSEAQLVVVCGRNATLRRRVEALPRNVPVRALGFVDNVAELMRSADVLVTKAGGLTLAEAFCCGVPVVVHDLLPGQEAGNLAYVLGEHAVEYAPRPAQLARTVKALQSDPARRADLVAQARRLARPQAADEIADGLLARLSGPA
jgi:processive 1,2-diacylglycerol beta-glucosyltransferase